MKDIILKAIRNFEELHTGYVTWGQVQLLCLAVRNMKGNIFITNPSKEINNILVPEDIFCDINSENKYIDYASNIFHSRKNISCILFSKHEYGSNIKKEIPPILDDQAQLLGVSIKIAKPNAKAIVAALRSRYAAITEDGLCISLGSTIEDTYVAAQLLEKTSKCYTEAQKIGGAKTINCVEAWLMQQFYLFKYSKAAENNR